MEKYRVRGPDGKIHVFSGPKGLSQDMANYLASPFFDTSEAAIAPEPEEPKGETGFIPSVMRGGRGVVSLATDILPAMVGKAVGAEDYAKKQLEEAAAYQKETERLYPAEVASYKDIDSPGKALTYIKEAIGEAIPSILPSIFTGGAAGILARPATAAAMQAAEKVAAQEVARATAKNVLTTETIESIKKAALDKGVQEARKIALKYEAAGALTGSAAQNIPDVYQNIYEATGEQDLGAALAFGSFNAVLDAITPLAILRKAKAAGIPEEQIIGAWYKRAGKGALKGFATEGGTESLQEMSSATAEKFVDENQQFFSEKNFERFINAGLKGGFGGAGITAAADVAFGRGEKKGEKKETAAPLPTLTPEQRALAGEGMTLPEVGQDFEIETTAPADVEQTAPPAPPVPANVEILYDEVAALEEDNAARKIKLDQAIAAGQTNTVEFQKRQEKYARIQNEINTKKKLIADASATQTQTGAPDVGEIITPAGGAGADISAPASIAIPPTAGIEPPPADGMVPAGADVTETVAGTTAEPATVTEAPSVETTPVSTATAPTAPVVSAPAAPQVEAQPVVGVDESLTRPTPQQIATGMKFDEATVGSLYNEDRIYGTDETTAEGQRATLPEWDKLTRDQKDLYLGSIVNNTAEEHDAARKALIRYRNELREVNRQDIQPEIDVLEEPDPKAFTSPAEYQAAVAARKEKLARLYRKISDIKADPAAASYVFNREAQAKLESWDFPTWDKLSPEDRKTFTDELQTLVGQRKDDKGKPLTDLNRATGVEIGMAFRKLGEKMVARAGEREQKAQAAAKAEYEARQAQIEKEAKEKSEQEKKQQTYFARVGKMKLIPEHVIKQIMKGNLASVLDYLRTASGQKIHRAIAQKIYELKLSTTKIKLVDELPQGHLAQYDPATDTIEVTPLGLRDEILLHELAHAATVNVLNRYLTLHKKGKKSGLTEDQITGAEHLEDLMEHTKNYLGNSYPDAFENLYEFVGYALSDQGFQTAMSTVPMADFQTTMLPDNRSAWSQFVAGIVEMFNWAKSIFTSSGEVKRQSAFLETLAGVENILQAPPANLKMAPLPAKTLSADEVSPQRTDEEMTAEALEQVKIKERGARNFLKNLFTKRGGEFLVTNFQNERYPIKQPEDRARLFGILKRFGDGLNNVYGQISRSAGIAVNEFNKHLLTPTERVHTAVEKFAETIGTDVRNALAHLHLLLEAYHEPERRMVKYLKTVPLDDTTNFKVKGFNDDKGNPLVMNAAGWRDYIFKQLSKPEAVDAKGLRRLLNQIALNPQFRAKVIRSVDSKGNVSTSPVTPEVFDINNVRYNVIAERTPEELRAFKKVLLPTQAAKDAFAEVQAAIKQVQENTKELNKRANYYSQPVDNVINFYGFENYVPFKGRPGQELINEEFNIESRYIGGELQEADSAFGGRMSESENPLLQTLADGATSALRLGRKDLTLAIKNAVNDKILRGKVQPEKISFEDRFLRGEDKKSLGGPNKVFHYNPDGSIEIIELNEPKQREAIRRTYRKTHPLIDYVNQATSFLGQMHTRYNPAFAPMNFVRDALTNAFTLGAELGPDKAGKLLTEIAREVAGGGMAKSFRFARLYETGKLDQIEKLAETDPYIKDIKEYVDLGGKVEYLQGIAAKGALESLVKEVGRSNILKTKDQIDKFVDVYNDVFELSSRVAAYRVLKEDFYNKNLQKGMKPDEAMADAMVNATEYAKNLANFEQVGRYGKEMGSLFMFFRPAATGAVRAIEALAPAYRYMPKMLGGGFDEAAFIKEAKAEGRTDEQIKKALDEMEQRSQNAARMAVGLMGVGVTVYMMALLMAGDDDAGRNRVATDDMARWTRYARIFIPGLEHPIQMPWGFGLGAFAAAGAQLAAVTTGRATVGDIFSNIMTIGLDSFLPLPFSRISPLENFPAFAMDSVTPSLLRPFFEYVMNLDGLGREIYNNRQSRYGDAYTGGDNIPESYKVVARGLFNATDGAVDFSPNTLYFFANNYADGVARMITSISDVGMAAAGNRELNAETVKAVVPFMASFIGSKSNYDAREFNKFEKQVKETAKRLDALKNQPEKFADYVEKHPNEYALVEVYNQQVNGALKTLRAEANRLRAAPDMPFIERKKAIKEMVDLQNMVKRDLLETFKQIEQIR